MSEPDLIALIRRSVIGCDEVVGPRLNRVGEVEQSLLPHARGGVPPALERLGSGRDE